ncbi:MAG: FHA domain-containing protein [Candidatus Solibacter sp.]
MRRAHNTGMATGVILLALLGCAIVARAQVADPVRAAADLEVARMLNDALQSEDPAVKLRIYEKILKEKDPLNTEARAGFKEAKVAVDQKKAVEAEKERDAEKKRADKERGRMALRAAESMYLTGDFLGARQKFNEAMSLGQSGPNVQRVGGLISSAESGSKMRLYALSGGAAVVILGLVWWIVSLFRKGQPYVEILTGAARGRRFAIENDVLTVGALAQKGEEKNDVVVSDAEKTISRFHCEVHRKGKRFYLVDCQSANGTRLDGRTIPAGRLIPLKRGARIQLGASCTLKFGFERRKR